MTAALRIPDANPKPLSEAWRLMAPPLAGTKTAQLLLGRPQDEARSAPHPRFTLSVPSPIWARGAKIHSKIYLTAAVALLIHLLLALPFIVWPVDAPATQIPIGSEAAQQVEVSVITDADLKKFGHDTIRQDSPPPPITQTTPADTANIEQQQQKAAEAQPQQQHSNEESTASDFPKEKRQAVPMQWDTPGTQKPFDLNAFAAGQSQAFSQDLKQAFAKAEEQRKADHAQTSPSRQAASFASRHMKAFRPAASHGRASDAFERDVIWALAGTVPQGNGTWGSTIVTFTVSMSGRVEDLQMIKSSGDKWLDTAAMLAVRQAHMPVPPAGLSAGDRQFRIEYISRPEG